MTDSINSETVNQQKDWKGPYIFIIWQMVSVCVQVLVFLAKGISPIKGMSMYHKLPLVIPGLIQLCQGFGGAYIRGGGSFVE